MSKPNLLIGLIGAVLAVVFFAALWTMMNALGDVITTLEGLEAQQMTPVIQVQVVTATPSPATRTPVPTATLVATEMPAMATLEATVEVSTAIDMSPYCQATVTMGSGWFMPVPETHWPNEEVRYLSDEPFYIAFAENVAGEIWVYGYATAQEEAEPTLGWTQLRNLELAEVCTSVEEARNEYTATQQPTPSFRYATPTGGVCLGRVNRDWAVPVMSEPDFWSNRVGEIPQNTNNVQVERVTYDSYSAWYKVGRGWVYAAHLLLEDCFPSVISSATPFPTATPWTFQG